jgi:hypothetical protein
MHGPIDVKSPNNIREWQMGFNPAFKGLKKIMRNTVNDFLFIKYLKRFEQIKECTVV